MARQTSSMYRREPQLGSDGRKHELDGAIYISPQQGMALYRFAKEASRTCEIGMAYGYSTLFFMAAGREHTAIDPFQEVWHGVGREAAGSQCRWINERSDRASTDLERAGESFDLIFIDGNHRFDDVLTDFYLFAPLCRMGGRIILDDMWMPSIQTIVAFLKTNRQDFELAPLDPQAVNISVFRKVTEDRRDWNHFTPFY
jgi:predicted O-methyltransferase YrrM